MLNEVKVWDPLVRVFHWSLVLFFVISYVTGEDESSLHIYAGYIVLGLITFRVLWGIVGTKYARFSDFIYSPKEIIIYTKSFLNRSPKHYLGHNPLGGLMVLALLLTLFVVTVSGLKLYAVEEGLGPLAGDGVTLISSAYADSDDDHDDEYEHGESGEDDEEEFWEEIHEGSTNFMLFLIFLHISGVLVSGRMHKENLVKAMITGKKIE
ncbi:MAG: cytochrome b/b6 domain-containing protein [Gammaproteobacteria bacterium]|nr:cytochrome b/b6 domain-containing protein [Gammaproteobacteria bacterium]